MKGLELLSSILALLMMLGVASLLGGVLIYSLNAAKWVPSSNLNYDMYISPIYPPIKYEAMLLSYMELRDDTSGYQIKRILTYAALQNNVTNVFVEGGNEVTSLRQYSSNVFNRWLYGEGYLLILNSAGRQSVIASNSRGFSKLPDSYVRARKVSIPLYIDSEMIIGSSVGDIDLPLNVTLDLYVQ